MNNADYFNTSLSKLKIDYPDYIDTVRIFLANACSYAERNLYECGYLLFGGELGDKEYKKITKRIKSLSNYSMESLNCFFCVIRLIHNYSYHYYCDRKVTVNKRFMGEFNPLTEYDYELYEKTDEKFKEITFYGAIIIISSLLDSNQIKSVSEDFKSLFLNFENPIYSDILDKTKAKEHLAKVMKNCANGTVPFVNLHKEKNGDTKNVGFDTNTLFRRYLGKLFFKIEEYSNNENDFYKKLVSLNLNNSFEINKISDLRNWYSHGGYIFDDYRGKIISPENIVNTLYDIYYSSIDIRIKNVIKDIALEHLRDSFEFMSKYSIKLFDKDILLDGIKYKKRCIHYRIVGLDYNNPLNTDFYSNKSFEKLMKIIGNTYVSNYDDENEFHGFRRNFTTDNIMFVTLKSSNNISLSGNVLDAKEITFINPLLFRFKTDDVVNFVNIDGIKITDILPTSSSKVISRIEINLDDYEKPKNENQYLFYDIECANCHNNTGKISSIGYVVTNSQFEKLESCEIIINPEAPFFHDVKRSGKKIHIPFNDFDTEKHDNSPTYKESYELVKDLFSRPNTVYLGYSNVSDAYFIFESNQRYNLPNFDYRFIDIKDIVDYINGGTAKRSLQALVKRYLRINWKQSHNSKEDANMTLKVLKAVMKKHNKDSLEELADASNAIYDVKDNSVVKNGEFVEKIIYPDMLLNENGEFVDDSSEE